MILVDTSVWIDFFRGADSLYCEVLRNLIEKEQDICLSEIILAEILQGIKEDKQFENVKSYLLEYPIYSARNTGSYIQAAQIYRICRKKGRLIKKTIDCILASIAIENELELFHKDRDFDLIAECTPLKVLKVL